MRLLLAALLLASPVVLAAPAPAFAQSKAPAAGAVNIKLLVVHATDNESGVDPRLQSLASSFRHLKYKGYRLLDEQKSQITREKEARFSIEGNRQVTVTLVSRDADSARMRVEMTGKSGKFLDTTVKVARDTTVIVAGPSYKDGILLLPVQASY